IISRGFIYMRDSEELMNTIRQYLKQKAARSFGGKRVDLDVIKKEIKDEVTHILYDQTRRTPIVIPVINEIGGGGQKPQGGRPQNHERDQRSAHFTRTAAGQPRKFQPRQVPDSEAVEPKTPAAPQAY
ncbi:MAG TPA: ribonuclease J, partial [Candidatus Saccharimonadaceae bacterium]|nr:ribonuclease J [Candidatus Saccharimonadaceae bacterium]